MSNKSNTLLILSIFFTISSFVLLMLSMNTHHWRKADVIYPIPPPVKAIAQLKDIEFDVYHGLWSSCSYQVDSTPKEDCSRIKGDSVEGERQRRGNATRGLLFAAILFAFLSMGLSTINICIPQKKIHIFTTFVCMMMVFLAFISGVAAMANFHDFFKGESFTFLPPIPGLESKDYKYSWDYSYYLGWVGSVLLVIPILLLVLEMLVKSSESAVGKL